MVSTLFLHQYTSVLAESNVISLEPYEAKTLYFFFQYLGLSTNSNISRMSDYTESSNSNIDIDGSSSSLDNIGTCSISLPDLNYIYNLNSNYSTPYFNLGSGKFTCSRDTVNTSFSFDGGITTTYNIKNQMYYDFKMLSVNSWKRFSAFTWGLWYNPSQPYGIDTVVFWSNRQAKGITAYLDNGSSYTPKNLSGGVFPQGYTYRLELTGGYQTLDIDFGDIGSGFNIMPIYVGKTQWMPDKVRELFSIKSRLELAIESLNTPNAAQSATIANNDSKTNSATSKVGQLENIESTHQNSLNSNLAKVNVNQNITSKASFVKTASFVATHFNNLTVNNPFGDVITYSLILGLSLAMIGKIRRN